jgi:phage terminase large subunit-like protein
MKKKKTRSPKRSKPCPKPRSPAKAKDPVLKPTNGTPDYSADIDAYMESVLSGKQPAGRMQILAVMRQIDDIKNAHKRGWKFNAVIANYSIWFIETACVHTKNSVGAKAGDPLKLTPTQKFIVWCLFGWRDSAGYRRFQKAYLEVARKYGKSTFAAAILLLVLIMDFPQEPEAEIYCAATKEKQAQIVFNLAKSMARKSPILRPLLQFLTKSMIYSALDSFVQPLGSDSDGTDGLNPSVVIKDELHAWQKRHQGFHEKLETGDGARMQPLGITITTAGDDRAKIWIEERDWIVRSVESVITGEIVDDRAFGFICCMDVNEWQCVVCKGTGKRGAKKCGVCSGQGKLAADLPFSPKSKTDPFDKRIWTKANPNMGYSVDFSKYEKHINRALKSPIYRNTALRYYGNVMVSSSEQLIDPQLWARCSGKPYIHDGQYCRGGIDLARCDDFASWSLVFPGLLDESPTAEDIEDGLSVLHTYDVLSKSYTCEARAEEMQNSQIDQWIENGLLECHPGDQVDFEQIIQDIVEISNKYAVLSWAFDQQFAVGPAQIMINRHGLNCTRFTQNPSWYNPGIRELLRALRRGDVSHGGDPVLAWQAENVIVTRDARDLWMPDKSHKGKKIDGMVSMLMGISDCLFHASEDDGRRSVYETRGIRTI